jgi:RimJ/RimL family protein N-acetyltransferase
MIASQLARLAATSLAHNRHYNAEKDFPKLLKRYTSALEEITQNGTKESFTSGSAEAFFCYYEGFSQMFQRNMGNLIILMNSNDDACVSWIVSRVRDLRSSMHKDTYFDLPSSYMKLLPHLIGLNFNIDAVELLGQPAEGLRELSLDQTIPNFTNCGYTLGRLASLEDIDAIINLKSEYFQKHPEFCWFFDRQEIFQRERKLLMEKLRQKHAGTYVLRDHTGVVGTFGFDYDQDSWTCGMDFAFHPKLHGRGLGKAAYQHLLQQMVRENVNVYRGSTANPAVLRLGKRLKREATYFHLRSGHGHFPPEHFQDFFPKIKN